MLIHVKSIRIQSWGYHSMQGWYFSLSLKHYRSFKRVIDTAAVRLTGTFKFKHHEIKTSKVTQSK